MCDMEIAAHTTTKEGFMSGRLTYEVLVRVEDERHVVRLEAATIREALDRASRIWSGGEVTLLAMIDREPQKALAFA